MEAFGTATGGIALVGAVADAAKETVKFLRRLKHAPQSLLALTEEVTQLQGVIDVVRYTCELNLCPTSMPSLLEQAKARLLDLNTLIYSELTKENNPAEADRLAWTRNERRVKELVKGLRNIRNNVVALLSASTLYVAALISFRFYMSFRILKKSTMNQQ